MVSQRSSRKWILTGALVALLLGVPLYVCGQGPEGQRAAIAARYPDVSFVTTERLAGWLDGGEEVVLLDARTPAEHRVSHLRGARRIDPDDPDLDALDAPRDARVVVYCSVGWRSGGIADRLQDAGWREVYNLEGGIFAWANEGRPVYRDGRRVREVHPYDDTWGRMLDESLHARE